MGSSVFLQIELKEKWYSTLNRWLSSASCKPERDHQPTMPLSSSWYHLARPLFRHYAHLSTWSFRFSLIIKPTFDSHETVRSRLVVIWRFIPLGSFTTESPGRFKGAWRKAPPQDQTVRISGNHNPPQHTANKARSFTIDESFKMNPIASIRCHKYL